MVTRYVAPKMRIVLTSHARHVVLQRGISWAWIEQAVQAPDWIEPDPSGADRRFRVIADREGRILRIVCAETDTEVRVITAFFDRNARSPR